MKDDTPDTTRDTDATDCQPVVSRDTARDSGHDSDATRHVPTGDTSRLLSQQEAAQRAGVSVRTLQRAVRQGDITPDSDSPRVAFRVADIDAWQARRAASQPVMVRQATDATPPQHDNATQRVAPVASPAPVADARDTTIAAIAAERDGLRDMLAFVKDQLELRREELDATHQRHAQQIADLTATIAAQADAIRALQAAAIPPQLVDALPTENAAERTETARSAMDPRPVGDSTLKRPSRVARLLGWLPFP